MKLKIGTAVAVAALAAFAAAGTARAQAASLPSSIGTPVYLQCTDGQVWIVDAADAAVIDEQTYTESLCPDGGAIVQSIDQPQQPDPSGGDTGSASGGDLGWTIAESGGIDVGFDADPNIAPDPSLYSSEVQCPDGSIWAVAQGDQFVCPAA